MLERFFSNERVRADTKVTLFNPSKIISTYLFVFAAGPYVFKDSPEGSGTVPMRLYSAKSS
jgi:aminopeptidase N